jgi:protein-disulfide isomerase
MRTLAGFFFPVVCSLLSGCHAAVVNAPIAVADSRGLRPLTADSVIAKVDDQALYGSDIDPALTDEIRNLENETLQRKYHLLWLGVENSIGDYLIQQEAQTRGIPEHTLLAEEVERQVKEPSEEDVQRFYSTHKDVIPVPLKDASNHIRKELLTRSREEQKRAFIDRLRTQSNVVYTLVPPELPRYPTPHISGPTLGPENAKIKIILFSDFECSYSSQARRIISRLTELYPNLLQITYQHLPLQQHTKAYDAALAAECAHQQSKFWPYYDMLFEHANALDAEHLQTYAKEIELDMQSFNVCLRSTTAQNQIKEHSLTAQRLGVSGTPAIFINSMKIVGLMPLPLLQKLIDRELQ